MTGTAYGYPIPETTDMHRECREHGRMYRLDPPLLCEMYEHGRGSTQAETRFVVVLPRADGKSRGVAVVDELGVLFLAPWVASRTDGRDADLMLLRGLGYEILNEDELED